MAAMSAASGAAAAGRSGPGFALRPADRLKVALPVSAFRLEIGCVESVDCLSLLVLLVVFVIGWDTGRCYQGGGILGFFFFLLCRFY